MAHRYAVTMLLLHYGTPRDKHPELPEHWRSRSGRPGP